MKCRLSTINGWCGIFNKSCKECISPTCEFIKKAYRQGRNEAEYFGYYKSEWIPVSERLPEITESGVSDMVLLCWSDGQRTVGAYQGNKTFVGQAWPMARDCRVTVIAWQPLPEPYEGGDVE